MNRPEGSKALERPGPSRRTPAMTHSTTAIFEDGAFRPIKPVQGIPEHATVRINVETIEAPSKEEQLALLDWRGKKASVADRGAPQVLRSWRVA
jgi:hypothetical protein